MWGNLIYRTRMPHGGDTLCVCMCGRHQVSRRSLCSFDRGFYVNSFRKSPQPCRESSRLLIGRWKLKESNLPKMASSSRVGVWVPFSAIPVACSARLNVGRWCVSSCCGLEQGTPGYEKPSSKEAPAGSFAPELPLLHVRFIFCLILFWRLDFSLLIWTRRKAK